MPWKARGRTYVIEVLVRMNHELDCWRAYTQKAEEVFRKLCFGADFARNAYECFARRVGNIGLTGCSKKTLVGYCWSPAEWRFPSAENIGLPVPHRTSEKTHVRFAFRATTGWHARSLLGADEKTKKSVCWVHQLNFIAGKKAGQKNFSRVTCLPLPAKSSSFYPVHGNCFNPK